MADVEVSYKGSTIGSLSASGTLTLETEGTWCEDDITVDYTSPGGGGAVTGEQFFARYTEESKLEINTSFLVSGIFLGSLCRATTLCLWNATGSSGQYDAQYFIKALTKVKTIVMPKITRICSDFCTNCDNLEVIDLTDVTRLDTQSIRRNNNFSTLILRGNSVVTLGNISAFDQTPFASGNSGGTLYVPNSLLTTYQSASNWSTILGYANNSIKSIESTHTDPNAPIDLTLYYADGTTIPT